jgi:hypothetical protein
VPIYDATDIPEFDLTDRVEQIHTLPLYSDGTEDLPANSAVAVAYSVGRWTPRDTSRKPKLNLNIQWVVALGIPESQGLELA